jgi:Starch-binding associating with outer membrane/Susd and RagB outer membrane lipoprotein
MALGFLFSVSSCDLFDLDINTNPNTPSALTPELLLTNVMVDGMSGLAGFASTAAGFAVHNTNSDNFQFNNQSFNGTWNFYYTGPLKDLDELIKLTGVDGNGDGKADNPRYLGMAQILKAYFYSVMVDMWGDVPFSEALKGNATDVNKAPVYDDDAAVYAACIQLLDDAIANIALPNPVTIVKGDIMYSTASAANATKWTKAANSLKLKLLLQTRLVDASAASKIQAIMNSQATLITAAADDFLFQFSQSITPDYRHSGYAYGGADYGGGYVAHQLVYEMLRPLTVGGAVPGDPRTPFYFKRQTKTVLDPNDATQKQTIPCSQRTDCLYNYFPLSNYVAQGVYNKTATALTTTEKEYLAGFFGRDRADPSGVPNDTGIRTAHGLYPEGGLYDDAPEPANNNKGRGDGIFPIATSWMVKFWQMEAMLTLGVTHPSQSVDQLFTAAMTEQMAKVNSFVGKDAGAVAMTAASMTAYQTAWSARLTAAGTNAQKLAVVLKQAWYCNYGNGFEVYNTFRRTGLPNDLQAPLQLPGNFALRIPYAQDELNLNPNTPVKTYDTPDAAIFWDQLKFQFVK